MRTRWLIAVLAVVMTAGAGWGMEKNDIVRNPAPRPMGPPPAANRYDHLFASFEESVPPPGWTIMTSGQSFTWAQAAVPYCGNYSAYLQWGNDGEWQDEWLITPALDTSGVTALFVQFMESGLFWEDYGYAHEILVSTEGADDPTAFTSVWRVTPADYDAPWLQTNGTEWGEVEVSLEGFLGGEIHIALRYEGEWGDDWWVDALRVFEPGLHDLVAVGLAPDGDTFFAGEEIIPCFTVANSGSSTETFQAELTIQLNDELFSLETITVEELAGGESVDVEFSAFAAEAGIYDLTANALLAEDVEPEDNSIATQAACYGQGRRPLGILYTNWASEPCVLANQALDAWYPDQGNEACLIRVHVFWPGVDDPLYQANVAENMFLLDMTPTMVWGVPTLYLENFWDAWELGADWPERIETAYAQAAGAPSPLTMEIAYEESAGLAQVTVEVIDPMVPGQYRLFLAITEDEVWAPGPNGEAYHNQAFRRLCPDTGGLALVTDPGIQEFTIPVGLNGDWDLDKLRATCWVQDVPAGAVLNAATTFLREDQTGVADHTDVPQPATRLLGAHPNPFNPRTTISFTLAHSQQVKLAVFDMAGKRVIELANGFHAAGEHRVSWQGEDDAGRAMPSGAYLLQLESAACVDWRKMVLLR